MNPIIDLLTVNNIVCPSCRCSDFEVFDTIKNGKFICKDCKNEYIIKEGIPLLINETYNKKYIQNFWGELYNSAYKKHGLLTKKILEKQLKNLESLFLHRIHLAVTEMPIHNLAGKKILEIGSGAGAHSAYFYLNGGQLTALDITLNRVIATSKKLEMINNSIPFIALQGDAENLPFPDNSFDIVYSNGVLHHTENTQKALDEVYRVLNPGGSAVIMLYCKNSFLYWVNLFFIRGIILGNIFRGKNWLGRVTEWMSDKKQIKYNPITKVYTRKQLMNMFDKFEDIHIRKSSFNCEQIPILGGLIAKVIALRTGYNSAGKLVYDKPWRLESKLELLLGKYIGFSYDIKAKKKNITREN